MADLRSSNPVLRRGGFGSPPTPTPEELASHFRQPTTLTVDDVIVHTLGLFGLLGVGAVVGCFSPERPCSMRSMIDMGGGSPSGEGGRIGPRRFRTMVCCTMVHRFVVIQ